ncbi:MAG TPA: bifunctional riboflavin kinase/FAD synthetase [Chromatiales bacterium]|nr:bifunctional riboflavin kinase/FAD synthetase [Thiotrichales bacterium]HIP69328.1 bifunctional riboflavin kinase/FAD synthetase [Chromatiales bacterium]
MQLIRGVYNLRPEHKGSVATIGNFDGVHRGHQAVIQQLTNEAARLNCKKTVITFEPLPQDFFLGEKAPGRLTPFRDKFIALEKLGVDQMLCLAFNQKLANLSAEDFIQQVLVEGLEIKSLVVGDDFCFGKNRSGNFTLLQQAGKQHGFAVQKTETFSEQNKRISSSRIRKLLEAGELQQAEKLLGRPYTMSGYVIEGDKRGREIGYPTANIRVGRRVSPLRGIFTVEVNGIEDHPLPGICSIGTRPTVNYRGFLIEVHLLDFTGDLYGRRLEIVWLEKLRDEEKFESVDAMVRQIEKDEVNARIFFDAEARRRRE